MDEAHRLTTAAAGMIAVATIRGRPSRAELEADGDIRVTATVADSADLPRALKRSEIDVIVLEADRTFDAVCRISRQLKGQVPDVSVVVAEAPFDAAALLDAVEAGISGYAPRDFTPDQVRRVIRAVAGGDPAIPRRLLGGMLELLMKRRAEREQALRLLFQLTERERVVLAQLTMAQSNQAIGAALRISPQTVRKHIQHVFTKLHVHSRLEAVTFVHRHALEDELTA